MDDLIKIQCPNCHFDWSRKEIDKQECDMCGWPNVTKDFAHELIEMLINKYMEECLPHRNEPFHHEAEIQAGFKGFIRWLKQKPIDEQLYVQLPGDGKHDLPTE